ncbi:MAG: glucose-1-phosphate cytidylyltransferase [Deltaproteobacteria bacterium]|nr:glucose-1-phosphate cytidylyltransferase [Deltaproteobacteria bacterium]
MKAIILAGGFGTRISGETSTKPKPMVEVGGKPMLWHIMKIFSAYGINEFIVALGYKGDRIKEYFLSFYTINNDVSVDLSSGETTIHNNGNQPGWKIHLIDTGLHTQTGGRLKRLKRWTGGDECFLVTYGDGVADINIRELLKYHKSHGKLATVTTVRSPARFGRIKFEGDRVMEFYEKPEDAEGWINGGFFVMSPRVLDYIEGDETVLERKPVERLAHEGQLAGYRHYGFSSCMDTLKEKKYLDDLWAGGNAPWKVWE